MDPNPPTTGGNIPYIPLGAKTACYMQYFLYQGGTNNLDAVFDKFVIYQWNSMPTDDQRLARALSGWNKGKNGNALYFDGLNDYVAIPSTSSLKYTGGNMTISFWMKTAGSETGEGSIISKPWNGAGRYNYNIRVTASNTIQVNLRGGDGTTDQSYTLTTTDTIPKNEWHHVMVVLGSDRSVSIYIDGKFSISGIHSITQWIPVNGDQNLPLSIGTLYPYGAGWAGVTSYSYNGLIDDVRIN